MSRWRDLRDFSESTMVLKWKARYGPLSGETNREHVTTRGGIRRVCVGSTSRLVANWESDYETSWT